METVQIIKKLNNTELGKASTNDTYILIPQELDITDLFPVANQEVEFTYKKSGEIIKIRHTIGREKRIVGLGPFYSKYDVCAGDEILLEKKESIGQIQYYIDLKQKKNTVVLQKLKNGFEVLTPERLDLLSPKMRTKQNEVLEVSYIGEQKKRQDSPEFTKIYDIKCNGQSIANGYSGKEIIELHLVDNYVELRPFCTWRKYKFE